MVKILIKRRKRVKKSNSFFQNELYKSSNNIQVLNEKKTKKKLVHSNHMIFNHQIIFYIILLFIKKSPTFTILDEESVLVHANSNVVDFKNKKYKIKNLDKKNNFSMITNNGPSFNRRTFTLMNINFEKEKLKKMNENKKFVPKPAF